MPKNKKQLILESIQQMDLSMLEVLLDDNKTYQGATKAVFLEKINDVFTEFKNGGDTRLWPYAGACHSCSCNNKGCRGYGFWGKVSKKRLDLVFKELEDDVEDIFNCTDFRTDEEVAAGVREYTGINDEASSPVYIDIKRDEKADFKPSLSFLMESQTYRQAYEELAQYKNTIIDKDTYIPWLQKHHRLYKELSFYSTSYTDHNNFYWPYNRVEELSSFLINETSIKEAIEEFRNLDANEEIQVLKWLSRYEKLGYGLVAFLYEEDMGREEFFGKREYFKADILKVEPSDFKHVIAFKDLVDKYYWDMLEKYQTISLRLCTNFSHRR